VGFKDIKHLGPGYYYEKGNERFNRQGFMKSKLIKKYNLPFTDWSKTEWEIVQELGYDRTWDCGKIKWELKV
jgi:hypothetical protein